MSNNFLKQKQSYVKSSKSEKLDNTFVIGDVHGCYHTLIKLISQLSLNAKLIFVGDLCDKGNFTKEVIEYVIENKHECILGNHEQLMLDNIDNPQSKWVTKTHFGGYKTLESYSGDEYALKRHLEWIRTLPHYLMKEPYFITHGFGLPYYQRRDEEKSLRPLMSNRESHWKKWQWDWEDYSNYVVINIFGHDNVEKVKKTERFINIDTGCVYGNKLTAIELSTKKVYSEPTDMKDIIKNI